MTNRIMDIETICEKMMKINEEYKKYSKIVIVGGGFRGIMACEELQGLDEELICVYDNDSNKKSNEFFFSEKDEKWIPCKLLKEADDSHFRDDILYLISTRRYYSELVQQIENFSGGGAVFKL